MRIELLYFEDCPGSAEALNILEEALAEKGISPKVEPVVIGPMTGSILPGAHAPRGDEDLFPPEKRSGAHVTSYRIHVTLKGPKNQPTAAIVREALARHLSEGQPANPRS